MLALINRHLDYECGKTQANQEGQQLASQRELPRSSLQRRLEGTASSTKSSSNSDSSFRDSVNSSRAGAGIANGIANGIAVPDPRPALRGLYLV